MDATSIYGTTACNEPSSYEVVVKNMLSVARHGRCDIGDTEYGVEPFDR